MEKVTLFAWKQSILTTVACNQKTDPEGGIPDDGSQLVVNLPLTTHNTSLIEFNK